MELTVFMIDGQSVIIELRDNRFYATQDLFEVEGYELYIILECKIERLYINPPMSWSNGDLIGQP